MKLLITTFLILSLLLCTTYSHTAEEWKTRSVYQIITDRFARSSGDTTQCTDLTKYCGGTYKGIQNNLDYIQGMGFDAIWISPIVENTADGYHGYWVSDLWKMNENFGTEEEFHELVRDCHERDIWIMVDVVANHVGYVPYFPNTTTHNFESIMPFDKPEHYNTYHPCEEVDPKDGDKFEICWLSGLPDLDQNHPFVRQTLLDWIEWFVGKYNVDALRIDTIPHVSRKFWAEFSKRAGIYTIGEVLNFDIDYLATYQGPVDGILNYALYTALRNSFQNGGSMQGIEEYYERAKRTWADQSLLGNFINNHDNPRFLSASDNIQGFKATLAFDLAADGIPMVYYGDEQAFKGGQDPMNREPFFDSFNRESDIYNFIKTINTFRKATKFYEHEQVQRYADESFYAFSRGQFFFAFTNSLELQTRAISYHSYPEGTVLCNIFHKDDCVTVEGGKFPAVLLNGEVKIFAPLRHIDARAYRQKAKKAQGIGLGITVGTELFDASSF